MPTLDISELNTIISILGRSFSMTPHNLVVQLIVLTSLIGAFTILYGIISVKIKQIWYLGEALPALVFGIILGPVAAKFIDSERWGSAVKDQTSDITLV
jgi:hypothetical protein